MAFFRNLVEQRAIGEDFISRFLAGEDGYISPSGNTPVSDQTALGLSVVWGCIQVKSQDMAKMPLPTYERIGDDERRATRKHPLHRIFMVAANPYTTAYTYRQTMEKDLCTRGNAYSIIERDGMGNVAALWHRKPCSMTPKIERGALVYRYEGGPNSRTYEPQDIFHLKGMSDDGITGLSPVEVFSNGVSLALSQRNAVKKTMENGARIPYFVELPGDPGPEKLTAMRDDYAKNYGGSNNAGKTPFFYGGSTAKPLGFSSKDAEILESLRFSVEEFCRIWRVPPYKVMDFLRATFSNVTETNISYVNDTLRPEQEMWEQSIHMQLLRPEELDRFYVEHDNYDLLKGTPMERAEVETKYVQGGISQPNEVRKSHNWGKVEGGDQNLVQMQMIPLKDTGKQQLANGGSANEKQPGA